MPVVWAGLTHFTKTCENMEFMGLCVVYICYMAIATMATGAINETTKILRPS